MFGGSEISCTFALANKQGAIAQLVEQRTENPCVPGSIPGGTTKKIANSLIIKLLAIFLFVLFDEMSPHCHHIYFLVIPLNKVVTSHKGAMSPHFSK